jgi:hypothetical protein
MSFADFMRFIPDQPQGEDVAGLINVTEHEPLSADSLVQGPGEYDQHMERIREPVRASRRREAAG